MRHVSPLQAQYALWANALPGKSPLCATHLHVAVLIWAWCTPLCRRCCAQPVRCECAVVSRIFAFVSTRNDPSTRSKPPKYWGWLRAWAATRLVSCVPPQLQCGRCWASLDPCTPPAPCHSPPPRPKTPAAPAVTRPAGSHLNRAVRALHRNTAHLESHHLLGRVIQQCHNAPLGIVPRIHAELDRQGVEGPQHSRQPKGVVSLAAVERTNHQIDDTRVQQLT